MKHTILILTLSTAWLGSGCDEAKPSATVHPSPAPAAIADEPPATQAAQIEECLVCVGHKIAVKPKTPRTEYAGKMYYFCSTDCLEAFKEEPAKYLASATTQPATMPHDHVH